MEGQEITDDQMRTKRVTFITDPRLAPGSQVPYPKNQVLWWTQGSIVSGTLIKTQVDETRATDCPKMVEVFGEMFDAARDSHAQLSLPAADASVPSPKPPDPRSADGDPVDVDPQPIASAEEVDTCQKSITKRHSQWELKHKDIKGLILRSEQNTLSAGSKVELRVKELVQETVAVDVFIMGWDTSIRAKHPMTNGQIAAVKSKCVKLVANAKILTKLAGSLKTTLDLGEAE